MKHTLLKLAMEHRYKAKQTSGLLRKFHWSMAFEYLDDYRRYYGGSIL